MRHINIPVFIPHLGCPNQCIFCNQRYISGTMEFSELDVKNTIERVLDTVDDNCKCEIAFFGGSFTGIDKGLMIRLLDLAQGYVNSGKAVGIRMSTRPDYISEEIISILKNYTVTFVELGIQSMNDFVLNYLKRGHTSDDTRNAALLLKNNNIPFVGQMMIGLPSATLEDELYCAEQICKLGACAARIYPTLVFKMTELEGLTVNGEYSPLSLDEAVERSAKVLDAFNRNHVECIRIGLCDSDNLHSSDTFVAGPNAPSIGEMVKSRLYYNKLVNAIEDLKTKSQIDTVTIYCEKNIVSQIIGHKRSNIDKLKKKFGLKRIFIKESSSIKDTKNKFEVKGENSCV